MNKTEQALVKAIESKDYDQSINTFEKFTELKGTTDEQANSYFEKIESLKEVPEEKESEKAEEDKETTKETTVIVQQKAETRGRKGKSTGRKEVDKAFKSLLETSINYHAEVIKTPDGRFAKRLLSRLQRLNKQIMR